MSKATDLEVETLLLKTLQTLPKEHENEDGDIFQGNDDSDYEAPASWSPPCLRKSASRPLSKSATMEPMVVHIDMVAADGNQEPDALEVHRIAIEADNIRCRFCAPALGSSES